MNNKAVIKSDELTKLALASLVVFQLLLPNGFYLFFCYLVLFVLIYHLSQPYKPAVFTLIAFNHMVQIVSGVWLANYLGNDINYKSYNTGKATVLSCVGLLFLLAPVIYQQNKLKKLNLAEFRSYANLLSTTKSLYCYLIAIAITTVFSRVAFTMPGLTQVILSAVKIKWFFFLLFGYQVFLKNEKKTVFYLVVGFEFISGFYSFFSEFKTVIYYLAVLFMGLILTINFKQLFLGGLSLLGLLFIGLIWTNIKDDYRNFLNKGSSEQVASVSKDEAMGKLLELSNESQQKENKDTKKNFLERLQYTFHFAKAIERVPEFIPFQNGDNWAGNIAFATTPRFLNPDKPSTDNSLKATKYTGIRYLSAKQGVSFSLGYFAEFYIDFGEYMMMAGIFVLGFVYSMLYKYIMSKSSSNLVFSYSVAGAFFFEFSNFEMDGTFLTGRLFASLLTFSILLFFFSKPLYRFLTQKNKEEGKQNG